MSNHYDMADNYVTEVTKEYEGASLVRSTTLAIALLRACKDLLHTQAQFKKYKDGITRERKEILAKELGVDVEVLEDIGETLAALSSQDRSGEATPSAGMNGPDLSTSPLLSDVVTTTPVGSPVKCPNCGGEAEWQESLPHEFEDGHIYCDSCGYEEVR